MASMVIAAPAFAAATPAKVASGFNGMRGAGASGIVGTVSAVNGTTLTVNSRAMIKPRPMGASSTNEGEGAVSVAAAVYTVNASGAKVYKNGATSTVANIAVGDMVIVQGTVSGSNVTATVVRDGVGMGGAKGWGRGATSTLKTLPIKGNGQPVVGGNVTAISGTTLTVTNASNVTYAIDVSGATIVKNGVASTVSSVAIGDSVVVQGTVNGTSVAASSVIDQGVKNQNASSSSEGGKGGGFGSGIFGAIGGFFAHLFGF